MHRLSFWRTLGLACALGAPGARAAPTFVWPTPNPAYSRGAPFEDYVQPTVSGLVVSGLFGCVRTDGNQFHEGLDLKAIGRDRKGEATDEIRAIHNGVVTYISRRSGNSSFGIYVVIEHRGLDLPMISLYAHLRKVEGALNEGDQVVAGQVIGTMGRSAAGYPIPRERAHLHLETGLWLSREFQSWFDQQGYGSRNLHGVFNGMNTVGFDFHDLVDRLASGQVTGIADYLLRQPTAVTVEWGGSQIPDFVERYPQLLTVPLPASVTGWRVDVTWYGLPVRWTPLVQPVKGPANQVNIVFHDRDLLDRYPCLQLVKESGAQARAGSRLERLFGILFAD